VIKLNPQARADAVSALQGVLQGDGRFLPAALITQAVTACLGAYLETCKAQVRGNPRLAASTILMADMKVGQKAYVRAAAKSILFANARTARKLAGNAGMRWDLSLVEPGYYCVTRRQDWSVHQHNPAQSARARFLAAMQPGEIVEAGDLFTDVHSVASQYKAQARRILKSDDAMWKACTKGGVVFVTRST